MGFGTAVRQIIQQRAGGPTGIVDSEGPQDSAFKALDQMLVGIFFPKPLESGLQEVVQGSKVGVGFGYLLDDLGEVCSGKKTCVGVT